MKSTIISLIILLGLSVTQASETAEGIKKDYSSFKQEMQIKLNEAESKINELKVKAQEKSSTTQEKSILEYEKTRDKLKVQLNDLEKTGESKWKKAKKRMSESIEKLNRKVQKSLEN